MPKASKLASLCKKRRIEACKWLPKLSPEDVAELVPALNEQLKNKNPQVRGAACSQSGQLPPEHLAKLAPALAKLLKDEHSEVRCAACSALGQLSPKQLIEHHRALAELLWDRCSPVQVASCDALACLPPKYLMQHVPALEKLLTGPCEDNRCAACNTLRGLAPEQLGWYAFTMSSLVADESIHVSTKKLHPIRESPTRREGVLIKFLEDSSDPLHPGVVRYSVRYVEALASRVINSARPQRNAAGKALGFLPLPVLRCCSFKPEAVEALFKWLEEQLEQKEPMPNVFRLPIEEAHSEGSTWLHLAAKYGSPRACRALRDAGAALARRNRQKKRPCDLAAESGHEALARELQPSTLETRGGTGNAMPDALACEDPIKEVTWWTLPLPSIGTIGGRHSMLKIKAGNQNFLVESALPDEHGGAGAWGLGQTAARYGLLVSHWTDVQDDSHLEALNVPALQVHRPIKLSRLVEHLVNLGKYNAANHNCHHTAFNGYNFCAEREDRLHDLPINRFLTGVAWALSKVGIRVAPSACCGQESRCAGHQLTRARGSSSCS